MTQHLAILMVLMAPSCVAFVGLHAPSLASRGGLRLRRAAPNPMLPSLAAFGAARSGRARLGGLCMEAAGKKENVRFMFD